MAGERLDQRFDAPAIGADGQEVLAEAGLTEQEIAALVADGVIVVRGERR
jgi:crotonobetainyl-CoA:carnitine CoA-transferase CaiB-like acyl-CoA transferase